MNPSEERADLAGGAMKSGWSFGLLLIAFLGALSYAFGLRRKKDK